MNFICRVEFRTLGEDNYLRLTFCKELILCRRGDSTFPRHLFFPEMLQSKTIGERPPGLILRADCPGFWVLGATPAPASTVVSELQIAPLV